MPKHQIRIVKVAKDLWRIEYTKENGQKKTFLKTLRQLREMYEIASKIHQLTENNEQQECIYYGGEQGSES